MAYRFHREAYDEAGADNATLRTLLHQSEQIFWLLAKQEAPRASGGSSHARGEAAEQKS